MHELTAFGIILIIATILIGWVGGFVCVLAGLLIGGVLLAVGLMFSSKEEKDRKDRYCPDCGNAIPFDANICPYCGKRLKIITYFNR
jgi:hypothetical protein